MYQQIKFIEDLKIVSLRKKKNLLTSIANQFLNYMKEIQQIMYSNLKF